MASELTNVKPIDERIMDNWVVARLVDMAAGAKANPDTQAKLRKELTDVAVSFAGPNPSPIEVSLAETAAINWFSLRYFEACFASAMKSEKGLTIAGSEFQQRRIDSANRRYLASLKTLAVVRRLAVPALQVNIATNQINTLQTPAQIAEEG